MNQTSQKVATSTNATFGKSLKFAAATTAVIVMMFFTVGTAAAAGTSQNVVVVNTPTVNANATITGAGPLTNVGRLASQQLMLVVNNSGICPSNQMIQTNPDGTYACFDMANYQGQVLVITDVTWSYGGNSPGIGCTGALRANGSGFPLFNSIAFASADGVCAKSEHLTTGFKTMLNLTSSAPNGEFYLQGYLVPNK